jgi:hypothetical protein
MVNQHQHLFLLKRLIVESEWWLRDYVRCMGNLLYHSDEQIIEFINCIRNRIAAIQMPGISLNAYIAVAKIFYIADQRSFIKHLEYELSSPLRLFSDLEAITLETENHHNLQKPLPVKCHYGTNHECIDEVRSNPAEVICILSLAKDRKRVILERKSHPDRPVEYNTYVLDTQTLPNGESQNFENLRDYLDPFRFHLVSTGKFIVNAAFYYFDGTNLKLNFETKGISERFTEIPLNKRTSDKKQVHQDLITCRENKRNHFNSLQNLSSFYNFHKSKLEG